MNLIERLHCMSKEDGRTTFEYALIGIKSKLAYVWWTFSEWVSEYRLFCVVPGVCIDAKSVAKRFNIPLIKMSRRTSSGRCRIYAVGFIDTEDEDALT